MTAQTCHTIRSLAFIPAVFQLHLSQQAALYRARGSAVGARRYTLAALSDSNKVLMVLEREAADIVEGHGGGGRQAAPGPSAERREDERGSRQEENAGEVTP